MDSTIRLTPTDAHSWVVLAVLPSLHKPPGSELRALPLVVECHRSSVDPSVASSADPSVASQADPSVASQVGPSVASQVGPSAASSADQQAGPQVGQQAGHQELLQEQGSG